MTNLSYFAQWIVFAMYLQLFPAVYFLYHHNSKAWIKVGIQYFESGFRLLMTRFDWLEPKMLR